MQFNPIPDLIRALFDLWRNVFGRMFLGPARLGTFRTVRPRNRFPEEVYIRAVVWNAVLWIGLPLFLLIGNEFLSDSRPFTAWVGVFLGLSVAWLSYIGTPLGVVIDEVTSRKADGLGTRYVKFVQGLLFGELALAMTLWVLPFTRGRSLFPIFLIAAMVATLGYKLIGGTKKRFVRFATKVAVLLMILFSLALFFPNRAKRVAAWAGGLDNGPAEQDQRVSDIPQSPVSDERLILKPESYSVDVSIKPDTCSARYSAPGSSRLEWFKTTGDIEVRAENNFKGIYLVGDSFLEVPPSHWLQFCAMWPAVEEGVTPEDVTLTVCASYGTPKGVQSDECKAFE